MVIPIIEERVIVTKGLVLVEEVRVKKIRREVREPQSVKLRREEVVVHRDTQNRDHQKICRLKGDRNG
jgi:stress response protein YsnF